MRSTLPPESCRLLVHAGSSPRWYLSWVIFLLPACLVSGSTTEDGVAFPPRRRTIAGDSVVELELSMGGRKSRIHVGEAENLGGGSVGALGLRMGGRRSRVHVGEADKNIFDSRTHGKKSSSKEDRKCNTKKERDCYRPCKKNNCDGADEKCRQMCRDRCCETKSISNGDVDDKTKKSKDRGGTDEDKANSNAATTETVKDEEKTEQKGDDFDSGRLCDKEKEKRCRGLCFEKEKCDENGGETCRKECRKQCCGKEDDKNAGREEGITNEDYFTSKKGQDDGENNNGNMTYTEDDDPQEDEKDDIGPSWSQEESETAKPTESQSEAPSIFSTSPSEDDIFSKGGDKLVSKDVNVLLTFDISSLGDLSAEDVMSGNGNTIKTDIEAGLGSLVPEIVEEVFKERRRQKAQLERQELLQLRPEGGGGDDALVPFSTKLRRQQQQPRRRRKLVVQYNEDVPPRVIGAKDTECSVDLVRASCHEINATSTLTLVDENEQSVLKKFQEAIIEAIHEGRLDSMLSFDSNSTAAAIVAEEQHESTTSIPTSRAMVAVGVAVGLLIGIPTLIYCFSPLFDKKRRRGPSDNVDGSFPRGPSDNADGSFPRLEEGGVVAPPDNADLAYDLTQIDEESSQKIGRTPSAGESTAVTFDLKSSQSIVGSCSNQDARETISE